MYDIIGDIHGHADHLEKLLLKLGYENVSGYYKHPVRKAIFVGDFIDRGPKIRETLSIVKSMTDENAAFAIMGNHEFNFLCYKTEISPGVFLRPHDKGKNDKQVEKTLNEFKDFQNELDDYLNWFRKLPLFLDFGDFRVVHAYWNQENIKQLYSTGEFTNEFLINLHEKENKVLLNAVEESLKGKEAEIPNGYFFYDADENERYHTRIKWWKDPSKSNYEDYFFEDVKELRGKKVELKESDSQNFYNENEIPVFFGHYWLTGDPLLQSGNVACLDYSVAAVNNILSAYRWNGEKELKNENFEWV